jgi:hypothetical protein
LHLYFDFLCAFALKGQKVTPFSEKIPRNSMEAFFAEIPRDPGIGQTAEGTDGYNGES